MMNDPREQFAASISRREKRWALFDEQTTSSFVRAMKLSPAQSRRLNEYVVARGRRVARMADFRHVFPDFPVYPFVSRVDNLRDNAGLSQIFPLSKIVSQPFVRAFFDVRVERHYEIGNRPLVLLIPWPMLTDAVAMHQIPYDAELSGVSIRITLIDEDHEMARHVLAIEPVKQLLPLIGSYGYED